MPFDRLAVEIDETARQMAELVAGISGVLDILSDPDTGDAKARQMAATKILLALQAEDRIAQRCRDLAAFVREMAAMGLTDIDPRINDLWARRTLDELRLSPKAKSDATYVSGEVDLF